MISREGTPELDLVVARPLHVPGDRHELRAGRGLHAELGVLVAAHADDGGDGGEGLDVVDQRRSLVEALVGWERRLQPRVAALALERVEQAGLLAADVGAGTAVDDHESEVSEPRIFSPTIPGGARFGERGVEDVGLQHILTADVDERARGAGGVGGDHDPLEQHVRGLLHQLAVLEGAGLGLVGVAHEVLVHPALGQERDLLAHLEPCAPAPT